MTTLIIKSKIWNKEKTPLINYKDKNYIKQKLTVEKTGILYRNKDKITFKERENLNSSNNSSDNTNYMNQPKSSELISIEKNANESNFYVNCGDWSKDLSELIDQNATYFLYKGLTIENFLKEKQKYYVLNQGDIIKLGKIYLKILHIKLSGSNKKEDEDEKEKADVTTDKEHSDRNKKIVSDSESNSEEDNSENDNEKDKESNIQNDIKKEEDEDKKSEVIKRNYSPYNSNPNEGSNTNKKKENDSNFIASDSVNNNIANKKRIKKNKKKSNNRYDKLNRSFNGNISDNNEDQKIKENINTNRSMSFTLKKTKNKNFQLNLNSHFKSNNINNINLNQSPKKKIKKNKTKEKNNKPNSSLIHKIEKEIIKPQEKKEKGKICRICLSGEDNPVKNPLICPCICKGSMKFIHYFCLKNWLNLKIESDLGYGRDLENEQPTITYSTKDIACELCKTKLPDYIKHKGKIYNVSFYKPNYSKFIVIESIRDDNRRTKFIHIIPLNRRQIIKIGRLSNCDLSLPDFSISRVHCCMYIESGQLYLENNSKFGTKILVQYSKLTMSPQYPLCIEVQKTYLKLKLEKPFSLFSCCNVYTTSMSKMLVYQKQNEKGFDLFCSMVFKEDDGEVEEVEEQDENNPNYNNNINNNEEIKNDKNNIKKNITNKKDTKSEENKKSEHFKNLIIKKDDENNNEKNTNIDLENKDKDKGIITTIKLNNKENEFENKKNIPKDKESNIKKENNNIEENKNLADEKEKIVNKNNIKTVNDPLKKENKNEIKNNKKKEESIVSNNNAKKNIKAKDLLTEEENKKNKEENIKNEIKIEKKTNNQNKINSEMKLNKSKTIAKKDDNKDIKDIIDSELKMKGRRASQKIEIKNTKSLIKNEFKNFDKKIMKKNEETEQKDKNKKEEKIKDVKEKRKEQEKIIKKRFSIKNIGNKEEQKLKIEFNRQDTIKNQNNEEVNKKNEDKVRENNLINKEKENKEKEHEEKQKN